MERTERARGTEAAAVKPTLVLRADAAPGMGTGHVMRCIALGMAWQARGGQAVMVTADLVPGLTKRIHAACLQHDPLAVDAASADDLEAVAQRALDLQAVAVVVDGYHFPSSFHEGLRAAGAKVVLVDDHGRTGSTAADLILDQNLGADGTAYDTSPPCQVLAGPQFAVLRPEFLRPTTLLSAPPRRLLVTLGGDAPPPAWEVAAAAVRELPELEVTVIVGTGQKERDAIVQRLKEAGATVHENAGNMAAIIDESGFVLSAGGSTVLEVVARRRPLVCMPVADNQVAVADMVGRDRLGVALPAGADAPALVAALCRLMDDGPLRTQIRETQDQVHPGGAGRVVAAIKSLGVQLRPADGTDAETVWQWASDPGTRSASFHPDPIPWHEHGAWFQRRLADPETLMFIALHQNQQLGFVWFRRDGERVIISVNVAPAKREQGWGSAVIRAGTLQCSRQWRSRIDAYIRHDNRASVGAFANAGYGKPRSVHQNGQEAVLMHFPPGAGIP